MESEEPFGNSHTLDNLSIPSSSPYLLTIRNDLACLSVCYSFINLQLTSPHKSISSVKQEPCSSWSLHGFVGWIFIFFHCIRVRCPVYEARQLLTVCDDGSFRTLAPSLPELPIPPSVFLSTLQSSQFINSLKASTSDSVASMSSFSVGSSCVLPLLGSVLMVYFMNAPLSMLHFVSDFFCPIPYDFFHTLL